ncbi:hypothetical protein BCR33DRAFT_766680 [Rhizoclosmatium globosum]|uniref:Cyclic nucleotide-binding domain-containing protein n=1 Tax=Rhizoclosmatium globosum TaxID=329046 RepID=A0A1Y2C8Z8_9FUNG|nr:hypothetical protein BCR33DRAFT_766680 [Rhizoclosmatium globosum]|eukprot:ORY43511.1 hypothetical protein BCR33DRAFT_766680 [Rhizoclosmatium globosum]
MTHLPTLNSILLQNILELKSELVSKVDKLVSLLNGPSGLQSSQASPIVKAASSHRRSNHSIKSTFSSDMGIRWDGDDYATAASERVESNRPSIFGKPERRKSRSNRSSKTESPKSQATNQFEEYRNKHIRSSVAQRETSAVKLRKKTSQKRLDNGNYVITLETIDSANNLMDKGHIPSMKRSPGFLSKRAFVVTNADSDNQDEETPYQDRELRTGSGKSLPKDHENGRNSETPPIEVNATSRMNRESTTTQRHSVTSIVANTSESSIEIKVPIKSSLLAPPDLNGGEMGRTSNHERNQISSRRKISFSQHQTLPDTTIERNQKPETPPQPLRYPWLQPIFSFYCLIPAYDSKGALISVDNFDEVDIAAISFLRNGFHPKSRFITNFDFIMSLFHVLCIFLVPFLIGFGFFIESTTKTYFECLYTIVYLLDSIASLLTPQSKLKSQIYNIREFEQMRPSLYEWTRIWYTGYFLFDLFSVIPFSWFLHEIAPFNGTEFFMIFRLIRVIRLPVIIARCSHYRRIRILFEKMFGVGGSKIAPIGLGIYFFIHYNACSLYYSARTNGFVGWETFWFELKTANLWESYTLAFLLGVGNMFPMSFKPQTVMEQFVAIFYIFIGAGLYGILVGYISSAAISIDNSGRLYNQKMEELIDYIKWKKLSPETRQKLVSYYETKYRGKYFEEDTLLSEMNESLRTEISLHNTRSLIVKVPFLRRETGDHRDEIFYSRIASALHVRYFIPGDYITKEGESGNDMFFILSGKVDVFVNGHWKVALYDGAYFGEVALITKVLRTASVKASAPSVLYRLSHQDFHEIIAEFPDIQQRIDLLVFEREKLLRLAEEARAESEMDNVSLLSTSKSK